MYDNVDLVIYHANCPDGIAAAWCFKDLSNKFHAANHSDLTYPDVTGLDVVFLDFAYKIDVMKNLLLSAKSIRVLDHHKTNNTLLEIVDEKFSIVLDMDRSGAQIAWDEVNSSVRPWFIEDIADRDLWRWAIVDSKDVGKGMHALNYYTSLEKFGTIVDADRNHLKMIGAILNEAELASHLISVKKATECTAKSNIDNSTWRVKVVECAVGGISDIGNILVDDDRCDFAVMFRYNIEKNEWWCSARASVNNDIDLTKILKHFDPKAGGHPKAAGFTIYHPNNLRTFFEPKRFV
jgi:nanoRNase/pAp phosphatase (c-di-AMP/oligoRNAs hydrolase)